MKHRTSGASDGEGLAAARLFMVISSFSPLFVLWAIRGSTVVPDRYLIGFCAAMVLIPNALLLARIQTARRKKDTKEIQIGRADDQRGQIIVYLFTMLLPLYAADLGTWRDF